MSEPRPAPCLVAIINGLEIYDGCGEGLRTLGLARWTDGGRAVEVLYLSIKECDTICADTLRSVCWAFSAFA